MSIIYVCDCCKQSIERDTNRRAIQVIFPSTNRKELKHACSSCYDKYVLPAIIGDVLLQENTEDVTDVKLLPNAWDLPRVTRTSKYFREAICRDLHRYIIIGARPKMLSKVYQIPYQVTLNYLSTFYKRGVDFVPDVPEDVLTDLLTEYKEEIPKIKALLATCTWSLKEVADEMNLPLSIITTYWNNLPWFERDTIEKGTINGEDTDN